MAPSIDICHCKYSNNKRMGSALPLDSKYLKTMYGDSSCETASASTASTTPLAMAMANAIMYDGINFIVVANLLLW